MELEIGYAVIPVVDPEQGGDLLERISSMRKRFALEMGLVVPPIRIRDNMQLSPEKYAINQATLEKYGFDEIEVVYNPVDVGFFDLKEQDI